MLRKGSVALWDRLEQHFLWQWVLMETSSCLRMGHDDRSVCQSAASVLTLSYLECKEEEGIQFIFLKSNLSQSKVQVYLYVYFRNREISEVQTHYLKMSIHLANTSCGQVAILLTQHYIY